MQIDTVVINNLAIHRFKGRQKHPVDCSEEIRSKMPNSDLIIFENSGHYPFVEEQKKFTSVLTSFLEISEKLVEL